MSDTAASPGRDSDWLVGRPSGVQVWAALWIGSVGLLILGLQPLLLGALLDERRVDLDQLGLIATAEIIAIGLGSALATTIFSTRLRLKSAILVLALAALDYAVALATSPNALLIVRTLAGAVEGCMVAVSIELIARSRRAERLTGFFVALQTLAQCVLAFGLGKWVIHSPPATDGLGANAGFIALGIVSAASLAPALLVPAEYGAIPKQGGSMDGVLTIRAILALLSVLTFFMCIGAIWAFLEPLGARHGIDAQTIAFMVSANLGVQVLGALAATWLQERISYRPVVLVCGLVAIAATAIVEVGISLPMFWLAVLAIGFVWLFVIPFQVGQTVAADSSRSAALLAPAAIFCGVALGPLVASAFVTGDDASAVPLFAICAVVVSLALFGLFLAALRRSAGVMT
jgi:DHA1 family inner membrane transport protein